MDEGPTETEERVGRCSRFAAWEPMRSGMGRGRARVAGGEGSQRPNGGGEEAIEGVVDRWT